MAGNLKAKWLISSLLSVAVCWAVASPAQAWWNPDWSHRKKVTFNAGAAGAAGSVDHVPMLLRLHSGNFNFTGAKDDGSDLRLVAADDKTPLKYHVETYDSAEEMALVWVDVPKLSATDNSVWLYWGNAKAPAADDPKATYDVNQVAVFHLSELKGVPADSTAYANKASAFTGALGTPGVIGHGAAFRGAGNRLTVAASPSLKFNGGFTFSAWVKMAGAQSDAYLFAREQNDQAIVVGIKGQTAYCRIAAGPVPVLVTETKATLTPGKWQHLAVTIDAGRHLAFYLDGVQTHAADIPVALPDVGGDIAIGASPTGEHGFVGELDEIEIANTGRAAAWLKASVMSQQAEGNFAAWGEEETGEGGSIFANIEIFAALRNMSYDGWAILSLIILLGFASVAVFISKSYSIWLMEKANRAFEDAFRELPEVMGLDGDEDSFQNSSLYRVYEAGREALRGQGGQGVVEPGSTISAKTLRSYRAALEAEATRENQRLDRWVMVLTAAISGAPFLGLLGTCWGILNTFFAISLTGDANITAIAPGIATALVNTVVGLAVAIPALFGYNYIVAKVKNATADMYLFADELVLKVDEAHGEG